MEEIWRWILFRYVRDVDTSVIVTLLPGLLDNFGAGFLSTDPIYREKRVTLESMGEIWLREYLSIEPIYRLKRFID